MAFGVGGRQSAPSSTSGRSGCSRPPKCAPLVGAASRRWQGSPGSRSTINRGEDDLDGEPLAEGQVRRKGGGRKRVAITDPGLVPALKRLVEPVTRGDPVRPLTWVSKSMDKLATALTAMGHPVSADTVRCELTKLGFSRQHNRKADEGARHPDRNAQFEYINAKVKAAQAAGQPVISVDTKKKELVGNYRKGVSFYAWRLSP